MKELSIEEKAKRYDEAKYIMEEYLKSGNAGVIAENTIKKAFPELNESEDERIKREILELVSIAGNGNQFEEIKDWLEKQVPIDKDVIVKGIKRDVAISLMKYIDAHSEGMCLSNMECGDIKNAMVNDNWYRIYRYMKKRLEPQDKGEISDGYHTFNELYYYRMLYNAAFFNLLPKEWVHKSKKHNDGEECFGGGWFIVMANLPTGQISNHYELKDWDLFQIPEKEVADKWDGHTPQEASDRLHKYLLEKQGDCSDMWKKNTANNKPILNHSILMKSIYGIAEGEWNGEE